MSRMGFPPLSMESIPFSQLARSFFAYGDTGFQPRKDSTDRRPDKKLSSPTQLRGYKSGYKARRDTVISSPLAQNLGAFDRPWSCGRWCCINCKAPRVFFGPKTAHPHSGIPSPGTEQQRGQQVVSGQECMAYLGAVHGTCSSSAYARVLTRCRSHFFPIAVKLNPLNQFGRIGRADEVFAHE